VSALQQSDIQKPESLLYGAVRAYQQGKRKAPKLNEAMDVEYNTPQKLGA